MRRFAIVVRGRQNVHFKTSSTTWWCVWLSFRNFQLARKHCIVQFWIIFNLWFYFHLSLFHLSKLSSFKMVGAICMSEKIDNAICSSPLLHRPVRSDFRNDCALQNLIIVNRGVLDSVSPTICTQKCLIHEWNGIASQLSFHPTVFKFYITTDIYLFSSFFSRIIK